MKKNHVEKVENQQPAYHYHMVEGTAAGRDDDMQIVQVVFEDSAATSRIVSRNSSVGRGSGGNMSKRCDTVISMTSDTQKISMRERIAAAQNKRR